MLNQKPPKQNPDQNLNTKLQTLKQMLQKLLSNNPIQQRKTKQTNNKSRSLNRQHYQYQYSKKNDLQKQNKIMMYELKLLTDFVEMLEIDEDQQIFVLGKEKTGREIMLRQINQQLQAKVMKLEGQICNLKKQKQALQRKIYISDKNSKIYEKVFTQYQKIGGMTKYNQLKDQLKQAKQKLQQQTHQLQKSKQQTNKQKRKCIILQQLNKQTQQKLCQALISNKNSQKMDTPRLNQKIRSTQKKQNVCENIVNHENNYKFELLAAKEQIRQLKNKINSLQKQKDRQKIKYQEKQNIYEKLVMKSKIL